VWVGGAWFSSPTDVTRVKWVGWLSYWSLTEIGSVMVMVSCDDKDNKLKFYINSIVWIDLVIVSPAFYTFL